MKLKPVQWFKQKFCDLSDIGAVQYSFRPTIIPKFTTEITFCWLMC